MRMGLGLGLGSGQRVSGDGYTAEAQAYFTAMAASNDLTVACKDAINELISTLVSNSLFATKFDCMYLFALNSPVSGISNSLVNLVNPTNATYGTAERLTSGAPITTWENKRGWTGATSKALNTKFIPDANSKLKTGATPSSSLIAYDWNNNDTTSQGVVGVGEVAPTPDNIFNLTLHSGTVRYSRLGNLVASDATGTQRGLYMITRSSKDAIFSCSSTVKGSIVTSETIAPAITIPFYILAQNVDGVVTQSCDGSKLGFVAIGASLTATETTPGGGITGGEYHILRTAINTYMAKAETW